jgi:thiol:disulfide interchange protein DsbD
MATPAIMETMIHCVSDTLRRLRHISTPFCVISADNAVLEREAYRLTLYPTRLHALGLDTGAPRLNHEPWCTFQRSVIMKLASQIGRSLVVALAVTTSGSRLPLASHVPFGSPAPLSAQEHPIKADLSRVGSGTIAPGGKFTVRLRALIPSGWHLYSLTQPPGGPIASTIDIDPVGFKIGGPIDGPVPTSAPDPNFGITSETYEDSAVFHLPIAVAKSVTAGKHKLITRFGYQTCNARYCLPPRTDTLEVGITVGAGPTSNATSDATPSAAADPGTTGPASTAKGAADASRVAITPDQLAAARASTPAAAAASPAAPVTIASTPPGTAIAGGGTTTGERSFGLFLWIAATMGALALLTPCVFPMVPITISYFSQRKAGQPGAVAEAALYAFGIIASFTILGLGLSLIFGVAGLNRFAASAPLNLAVALLFIVFAMSLFGFMEIALPSRMLTALDGAGRSSRFGRVGTTLLMGATFAVTTFTCTAPFVGTLLVSAASGDWRWPAAGLFVFSSAFALPFFVLALVPGALTRLPRSGQWLVTMKGALAFIELAAAMKFISNADLVRGWGIFTRDVVLAIWVGLGLALALYLLGVRSSRWFWRSGAKWHPIPGALALLLTVWLTTGLTGRRLGELESFLPPAGGGTGVEQGELAWLTDDFDGALSQASRENKLVLVDFTGFTCTNCRWMEANMFPRDAVQAELNNFVRVRLFTDGADARYRAQQQLEQDKFQTVALPLYAVVDASGTPKAQFLGMTRDPDEFIRFLSGARTAR